MVLTKACDIDSIRVIATKNNFNMEVVREKSVRFDDKDFIFQIASTELSHAKF